MPSILEISNSKSGILINQLRISTNFYATRVSLLLAVDFLSFVINGILLAYFSGINLLKVMKELQQDFWIAFAIGEGFVLMEVNSTCLGCSQILFYFTRLFLLSRYLRFYQLEVDMMQHWNWIGYMENMP